MSWSLTNAKTRSGTCTIIYSETTQDDNGDDVVETRTVTHDQNEGQNDTAWHANIRREIVADLSDLNKDENLPTETNITYQVK